MPQTQPFRPAGDMHFGISAPVAFMQQLAYARDYKDLPFPADAFKEGLQAPSSVWQPFDVVELANTFRGSATFMEDDLYEVNFGVALREQEIAALEKNIQAALTEKTGGDPVTVIAGTRVRALVHTYGFVSLMMEFGIADGWGNRKLVELFSSGERDAIFLQIRDCLYLMMQTLTELILKESRRAHGADACGDSEFDFPYFHVLYAGQAEDAAASSSAFVLDDEFRNILYPSSPEAIRSQSVVPGEFIFLGYAYSLVVSRTDPRRRLGELLLLVATIGAPYRRLARRSIRAREYLEQGADMDNTLLRRTMLALEGELSELLSPTWTYRHEFLVLRDHLLAEWRLPELSDRCRTVLHALSSLAEQKRTDKEARYSKVTNLILFFIALMSLIPILRDVLDMLGLQ